MRKALGRAILVAAVSTLFLGPMAGGAQAATAVPAANGTTVSKAHPCNWHPWHPQCRYWHQDEGLIDVDLL
ncbi:MAG TPA: hypothetical protein VNS49_03610 [Streptomyces sp.]|nr:hypothetical protein [Streptomyces sp.]